MKFYNVLLCVAGLTALRCEADVNAYVYETSVEFFCSGDFNGDNRLDLAIVDKSTGKFRLGYQLDNGSFHWVNQRKSGLIDVADVSVGHLLDREHDALVFASANDNQIVIADASDSDSAAPPLSVEAPALGPNAALSIDIGGDHNTPLDDLVVSSIFNVPQENKVTLMRNIEGKFTEIRSQELSSSLSQARVVQLKTGGPKRILATTTVSDHDTLTIRGVERGTLDVVAEVAGLPVDSRFVYGHFLGRELPEFGFYQIGASNVILRSIETANGDGYQFRELATAPLDKSIELILPIHGAGSDQLLAVFTGSTEAAVLRVTSSGNLNLVNRVLPATGETISGVLPLKEGFFLLTSLSEGKPSTRYRLYQSNGLTNSSPVYGKLASLADSDDTTVPAIRERILANLDVTDPSNMKAYTNTIPGSQVSYVMLPIPEGEFTMGSPESEKGHKPDETPQHRVKISPFWMGQCEVTWDEFELFLYADDEKKLRTEFPTDPAVNVMSDAVTRPSKPYADMTFGMGRDNCPAISMTQHAANKYCHWLSAKTGHFYRLPTEAEWEYACRAGTTTAYSFGDDPSSIDEYAWYDFNSDFKYHKIRRKKPNPWGLYDMHGNVAEWCLDQYTTDYDQWAGQEAINPWNRATKPYPHVVRGGSYDDQDSALRSAARRGSNPVWKMRDPQLPKSVWWFTDAQTVGFRIIRPLAVPSAEELTHYWISGVEKD